MRCRLILKTPNGLVKFASVYFSDYEPSFYLDFPYLKNIGEKFLAAKMVSIGGGSNLTYKRENCFFFDKTPKISYHLSGQVHIKNSVGEIIPTLVVNTKRLDELESFAFLDVVIKNPSECIKFNPVREDGTETVKNLIIDLGNLNPEVIELKGRVIVFDRKEGWFNEVKPNHPIMGGRIDGQTGKNIPCIYFCFQPTDVHPRVLFCFEINLEKEFYCDEDQLLMVRSGFSGDITNKNYCELHILAPRDPQKMIYVD